MPADLPTTPATVLTVGSLHYDIMVEAEHLPRRDETAIGSRWYPKFGGKGGNQAVSAAKSGVISHMFGAVGDDEFGRFLRRNLIKGGVDDHRIATIPDVGSGMSVAVQDKNGDYAATIVSGANLHLDPGGLANDQVWHDVSVLVLQNEISATVNIAAATQARMRGVRTILNAAPYRALPPDLSILIDILVVNAVEAEMMGAGHVRCLDSAFDAAQKLGVQFDCVVVTAGGEGLCAWGSGDRGLKLPAQKATVVSSHGAGDAFVGALAAELARGADLEQACRAASDAAAFHVAGRR
jgi:ribokinase